MMDVYVYINTMASRRRQLKYDKHLTYIEQKVKQTRLIFLLFIDTQED